MTNETKQRRKSAADTKKKKSERLQSPPQVNSTWPITVWLEYFRGG
jgi:hypothetical protein